MLLIFIRPTTYSDRLFMRLVTGTMIHFGIITPPAIYEARQH